MQSTMSSHHSLFKIFLPTMRFVPPFWSVWHQNRGDSILDLFSHFSPPTSTKTSIYQTTMTSALTVALAATTLATFASAFTPPSSVLNHAAPSTAAAASKTALHQELPFFAAPAFQQSNGSSSSSSQSGGGSQSSPPQSATVTLRLPLGTLFDGRDYIFVTESNVRGYEWTEKETDILLDDLMVS